MARKSSNRVAADYLVQCTVNQGDFQEAAIALEKHVTQALRDNNLRPLVVSARAKSIESIRGKLLRKPYKRPASQLTDRLGVRIVLYHAREVDEVAKLLRTKLIVREAHSSDKRQALGLREFGYRSYHLVGSLPPAVVAASAMWSLRDRVFEVQIRSLLEHVWAEIEHEVIYKSGAEWSSEIKRRFASIAAVLELLEHEFDQLERTATGLIDEARASLTHQMDGHRTLDVPSMCAMLEISYPDGLSFRGAMKAGKPFPPGVEYLLLLALRRAGVSTIGALRRILESAAFRKRLRRYASFEGVALSDVSHLAVLALLLAQRAPVAFQVFFPEFASDTSMREALSIRPV